MKFLAAVLFACVATLALLHSVYGTPVQPVPNPDANPEAVNPEAANPAPNPAPNPAAPMPNLPNPADPVADPTAPVPSPNPADPAPNPTAPVSSPVDKNDPQAVKPDGNIEFRGAGAGAGVNNLAHVPLTGPVAANSPLSSGYDDAIFVGNAANPVGDALANLDELNADAPAEQPAMIV